MSFTKEESKLVRIALSQYVSKKRDVVFTEREEQILLRVAAKLQ